jgi:6-phosphogluconolactonase
MKGNCQYEIKEFDHPDLLYHSLAKDVLSILPKKEHTQNSFSLVLSGGRSPVKLHKMMVAQSVAFEPDWSKVVFFFSDDRCVPPDNELSNFAMAQNTLFAPLHIQTTNIVRIKTELAPKKAAEEYHQQLNKAFQRSPGFDLALLGMGPDGHTASLFPRSEALDIQDRYAVSSGPGPEGRHRVSMTYRSLNASKRAWVMVTGKDKKKTLDRALSSKSYSMDLPIQGINPLEELIFYVSP